MTPPLSEWIPTQSTTSTSWREARRRPRASDAFIAITGLAIALLASLASLGCDRRPPPAPILVPSPMPDHAPGHYATPSPVPAPTRIPHAPVSPSPMPAPTPPLASAPTSPLCITSGEVVPTATHATIREPSTRGYLAGSSGDSATLAFTYRGRSNSVAAMASGDTREQLGLKLRAQDSCNVIYVMWRIEPVSEIVVQVKRNAGGEHRECGNQGYTRLRPSVRAALPVLGVPEWSPASQGSARIAHIGRAHRMDHTGRGYRDDRGLDHELRAAIVDDVLEVYADDRLVWRGELPASARDLRGPAGFRTDNVDVDLAVRAVHADERASCPPRPRRA